MGLHPIKNIFLTIHCELSEAILKFTNQYEVVCSDRFEKNFGLYFRLFFNRRLIMRVRKLPNSNLPFMILILIFISQAVSHPRWDDTKSQYTSRSKLSPQIQIDDYPNSVTNPDSPLMLSGDWVPEDPRQINFLGLPRISSKHVVISDVRAEKGVNQHNYLVYHDGRYWAMWSDGPGVEDRVGQRVAFATSTDGLNWSDRKYITPYPPNSQPDSPLYNTRTDDGFRYISRGFWQRGKELLALVSLDEAGKFFGFSLELRAFRLDLENDTWEDIGTVYDNTINNFPPKLLPNGEWMMSRRTFDRNVYMLTGGVKSFDQWVTHPVVSYGENGWIAEEPYWWVLPDGNLLALFRDNAKSGFLFRAFSTDLGRTWSKPVSTDFTDAASKFNGLQLSDGRYVLVSNPKPKKRDPLALSISDDGIVFKKMGYLIGGRWVDYPHVIEHNGHLLIAFSGGKQSIEVLKIKISDLDTLEMPSEPLVNIPDSVKSPQSPVMKVGEGIIKKPNQIDSGRFHLSVRKMIKIDDVKLSYVVRPGDGPSLILIPGSFSDANQWNEVIPGLGKNLNLILIEVRGHGKSWPPPKDGTIELLAKDVMAVTDKEELKRFYIGGHSIGGMISKEVGRCWPKRLKGVIPIEGWTHWQASRDAFNFDMTSTLTPELDKKRLAGRELGAGHWTDKQRGNFGSIWRKWEKGMDFLQNTNLPVMEIYGDRGKKRPSLEQLHIPDRPNIKVHWINNASHCLTLERPGEIATVIMQFIEKIEARTEKIK